MPWVCKERYIGTWAKVEHSNSIIFLEGISGTPPTYDFGIAGFFSEVLF